MFVDLKIVETENGCDIDWGEDGDFLLTSTFDTAVMMSMFCERRAKEYEVAMPQYRRGWIGNLLHSDKGEEDGCGLWLYEQSRLNTATINGIRDELEKGVLWMVGDVITRADVTVSPVNGKIKASIRLVSDGGEQADISTFL